MTKSFTKVTLVGLVALGAWVTVQSASAATFVATSGTVQLTYNINLNKSVYAYNEAIVASATYVQGACSNGQYVYSGLGGRNSYGAGGSQSQSLTVIPATSPWGTSGSATYGGLSQFWASQGGGNVIFTGSWRWGAGTEGNIPVGTIPYTVQAPTVNVNFN